LTLGIGVIQHEARLKSSQMPFPIQASSSLVAFIEPPQADVIEKILRHCGLWNPPPARAPPAAASVHDPDEPRLLTYVDIATFESSLWADF